MKTIKAFTLLIITISTFGCITYPTNIQLQKKYAKEDKELVSKLKTTPIPEKFLIEQTDKVYLKTGWYMVTDSTQGIPKEFHFDEKKVIVYLDTIAQLTPKEIDQFYLTKDKNSENGVNLIMYFNKEGTEKWSVLTEKSINRNLAFVINNIVVMTPRVASQITCGVSVLWSYNYTPEEMLAIKNLLQKQKTEN